MKEEEEEEEEAEQTKGQETESRRGELVKDSSKEKKKKKKPQLLVCVLFCLASGRRVSDLCENSTPRSIGEESVATTGEEETRRIGRALRQNRRNIRWVSEVGAGLILVRSWNEMDGSE